MVYIVFCVLAQDIRDWLPSFLQLGKVEWKQAALHSKLSRVLVCVFVDYVCRLVP